ncbi:5-oxoprolinase subunit PxpA [Clostridium sp. C8-1-8]|uniref:LamB/YcsF family protein n=1 Tax=Clostridium sp. C8-1-8 TaxID=2698831 RepID=UPI00136879C3|nr:5-oxoprolinase subunit PxpA [Clostridium sp. C8-1-8]
MYNIDINCDMGESFGAYKLGDDKEIIKYISSANIACGFHAGDPSIMRKTVRMAIDNNVAIGAHTGFQDLSGFGRRNINITSEEAYDLMVYQIGALYGFVKAEGVRMNHVKPHGALYNMAAKDSALAEAIARAIYDVDPELILFGLSGSEMIKAGKSIGIKTASEVFADRTYQKDGSLTPRSNSKALISSDKDAIKQVIKMITEGKVTSLQGEEISIEAHTVCIHGDGEKALIFAKEINETLAMSGVQVKSLR